MRLDRTSVSSQACLKMATGTEIALTDFKIFGNQNHKTKMATMQKNMKELQGIREDLGSFKMEVQGLGKGLFITTLGMRRKSEQKDFTENVVLETEEGEEAEDEPVEEEPVNHCSSRYI